MSEYNRRDFLRLAGQSAAALAAGAMLPPSIAKALSIAPARVSGTLQDVQHVVILMQENRSFDHYFGTLSGVRGFNDPRSIRRPDGQPVWQQNYNGRDYTPYHLDTSKTWAQWLDSNDHGWSGLHDCWNQGRNDQWMHVQWPQAMGYFTRADLPYYYPLADSFTVCEAYHASMLGPTNPNRLYLMSGRAAAQGDGSGVHTGNDMADTGGSVNWTSYAERLQQAGVSWRIYQQGAVGSFNTALNFLLSRYKIDDNNNYDCNALAWFEQFKNAPRASQLWERAMTVRGLDKLREDVLNDALPQVSWLVPSFSSSEHPWWGPAFGELYVAKIIEALTAKPEVWAKTVFLLTYDECDGFFDHMPPPTPPWAQGKGASTVHTTGDIEAASGLPVGLGHRVPMLAISPWSKGGWVSSEVFDHTSVIRFLEARFGVAEPNISEWRRAVCGDLTSLFDFGATADTAVPATARDVAAADAHMNDAYWKQYYYAKPDYPATSPALPPQERGIKPARAVPYDLYVTSWSEPAQREFWLEFSNEGRSAAVFQVYAADGSAGPWTYTVEPGKQLSDYWQADAQGAYGLIVYGPNGYFRRFAGRIAATGARPDVIAIYDKARARLALAIENSGDAACTVKVAANAYSAEPARSYRIAPGKTVNVHWSFADSSGWYDLSVTSDAPAGFVRQLAGHIETGAASITDPLLSGAPVV
ncbi:phosphocholine-specific phospholipase C [Lysobacter enzymogenes]|uniref:phosphocholine-specific phospholipase C n=1 Tax=Lysobacter enzymogenes TaxID=69 RepID=UPI0038510713